MRRSIEKQGCPLYRSPSPLALMEAGRHEDE